MKGGDGCQGEMEKAPPMGLKSLTMVEAAVTVKAGHRARVSVSAKAARKAPARNAVGEFMGV